MEVIVEHNYTAKEPDELTIKKGDIIHDVVKKPGGWWEGVLRDKKGVFPDNFVRQVDSGVIYRSKRDANRIRQCRVVFSYKQDHEDELSLNVGDVINILGEEEEGWWRGVLNGKEGVFPSNFVEEIAPSQPVSKASSKENLGPIGWTLESTDTPLVPPKPAKTVCQVRFSYKAENEDELTLNEGDLVTLISKEGQDSGWWKGELKGKVGVFPDNFVVVLTPEELIHLQKREEFVNQQKKEEPHKSDSTPIKASEEDQKSVNSVTLREDKVDIEPAARITPPVPGKKPSVSLKKSPSGSGSVGLFSGLRRKIADVVDGATSSKATPALKHSENKEQPKSSPPDESAFDQVARTPILQDVRATRAKAPGRRPPSVVIKDGEHGITNGFGSEHSTPLDPLTEPQTSPEQSDDPRRLRDQFKVPWLQEMKLNQAKRSSTSPKQEQNKFKSSSPEAEEKTDKPEKEEIAKPSVEPSKPVIKPKLRSSEYENVVTRRLAPQPGGMVPPTRPQTISTVTETKLTKLTPSPVLNKISPPPKPQSADRTEAKINKLTSNDQGRHSNEIRVSDEHGRVSHDSEKISSDHNKVGHDLSKISSEHGLVIHDSAKTSSEHGRVIHDSTKISSEHGRVGHDPAKISSDHGRVSHDPAKISLDHGRVNHDVPKISSDHGRVGHDHSRIDHDHARVGHDHGRVGHDHGRVGLDHGRVGHDHGRVLSNDHGENIKGSGDHSRNFDPYYAELLERIKKLEKQNAVHEVAIEELKAKLQLETDMRIMLQAELEKVYVFFFEKKKMELFGIRFAPFNIPMRRRLQTLAAGAWFVTMAFGGFIGLFLSFYLICFTRLWFITILYLFWIYADKDVCELGGRRIQWVRDWAWWRYLKEYFPLTLERVPWVELDPKRNYLFCSFPHGMLCTGAFAAFSTTAGGFHEIFPHHTSYPIALSQHFYMPFFRELALSLGGCASSAKSISSIISKPGGGNVAVLVVGGVSESFNCKPGQYRIVLKNRKGFVKLALKHGTPLVPVMSFGETDLFSQVDSPEGSFLRKVQEALRRIIGIAPIIPIGRGFFQYNFGLVPKRKPVYVVVGKPVDVQKIENPTRDDVDRKHAEFMKYLITFFEQEKHRYVKDSENVHLLID